jgi:hypothetical protein
MEQVTTCISACVMQILRHMSGNEPSYEWEGPQVNGLCTDRT